MRVPLNSSGLSGGRFFVGNHLQEFSLPHICNASCYAALRLGQLWAARRLLKQVRQ